MGRSQKPVAQALHGAHAIRECPVSANSCGEANPVVVDAWVNPYADRASVAGDELHAHCFEAVPQKLPGGISLPIAQRWILRAALYSDPLGVEMQLETC